MSTLPYILGFIALFSLFLTCRGLTFFYKQGEKRIFWLTLLVFALVTLLLFILLNIPTADLNNWLVLPALMLLIFWLAIGYLVDSCRKNEMQRIAEGRRKPKRKKTARGFLLRDLGCFVIAVILWCLGVKGLFPGSRVNTMLLCICLFLFTLSAAAFWRYIYNYEDTNHLERRKK